MDQAIAKQLVDKMYEKRKAAALELEKLVRECHSIGDEKRIGLIIDQLIDHFSGVSNALHVRNGGLIGLAGTGIALGVDIAPYMNRFLDPLLTCFSDPENRVRYFAAECLYNIAKVSKGEVLVYFNPIFDALSKLAADPELSVKNGAELLDRLLKDIVAESASTYVPHYPETEKVRDAADQGIVVPHLDAEGNVSYEKRAFSLARFIPLLSDRIYVISPFTRSFLVSWITVLDSVPELEMISYLPEFLDGLLKYLSDPTEDVRIATENQLAEFLREIKVVTQVQKRREEARRLDVATAESRAAFAESESITGTTAASDAGTGPRDEAVYAEQDGETEPDVASPSEMQDRDPGTWIPGQGVEIHYEAIIEILLQQLDPGHDEIQQSTALLWISEFLTFAAEVLVPFTPRLVAAVLPNLAHHAAMIQTSAQRTNHLLINVIKTLPSPTEVPSRQPTSRPSGPSPRPGSPAPPPRPMPSTLPASSPALSREGGSPLPGSSRDQPTADSSSETVTLSKRNSLPADGGISRLAAFTSAESNPPSIPSSASQSQRPQSPVSIRSSAGTTSREKEKDREVEPSSPGDAFDYQACVNTLTFQFLSEHEETRVAALKWLIMLHQKAPKKILAMDDGTFPALLKTLSDSSEEVIKQDLKLLAQISSTSDDTYFRAFMMNLLALFSTDKKLLETRGSLIIRQLCFNLNTDRVYRAFAEILEKEEDLEFASIIVQKLNMILITSPELADFRRRLKSLETRQDGQALFVALYRSWCHNPVSVFSLCLLAQAYEHASNLLSIFADLEITVSLLVQIDKLVQLIESPVFTYLRLQLLEPDRYPYLFKCLYGLLMLLPQSSAFVALRNRLNAVNSAGFLHIAPKPTSAAALSSRSKMVRDEIKWGELLSHFRAVQIRHEKARRKDSGSSLEPPAFPDMNQTVLGETSRPTMKRKVTGDVPTSNGLSVNVAPTPPSNGRPPSRTSGGGSLLSPLNPGRARVQGALPSVLGGTRPVGNKGKQGGGFTLPGRKT
ncbi:ARM repeat-containing protein [Peniophora sp. CONT]|nr:ARM repeat-containing protein [Peniophora sp. CONT]